MNSFVKQLLIILLVFSLFLCRSGELSPGGAADVVRNPVYLLMGLFAGRFAGAGGNNLPRNFRTSGGSLFAVGNSDTLLESTDGNNFIRQTYTLPNCTKQFGSSSFTDCNIMSVAKSGSNYYAIGIKEVGTRGSGFTNISERKFYFGFGNSLQGIQFNEITDANISSSSTNQFFNIIPSAASGSGFVFSFNDSSNTSKVCGTSNNGGSWSCVNPPTTGSQPLNIEILNGTMVVGIYYRWNGTFTPVTTTNNGSFNSMFYSAGRSHLASGNQIRYIDTDPSAWPNPTTTTTSTVASPVTSGNYTILGTVSGVFSAIGSEFISGTNNSYRFTTIDNGVNWSRQNLISISSGFSASGQSATINGTVFIYAQTNSGNFSQKFFKSTNFTEWAEFNP